MKTSIATVSISGDLSEKLAAIAAAGFDGVEIFEADLLTYDATPARSARMVRDAGLALTLFQPFRDFEGMPEPQRARAFDRAERKFDLMGELGADLILVCSNTSAVSLGGIDRAAADLRELGERAAARGIRIGFEALAWGRHVSDHRDAWEIVRRADHAAVGLILDSFHTLSRGLDPDSIRSIPADKLFLVQLADAPAFDMDLLQWSRHYRNMPGEGDLPVNAFLAAVAATGYDGWLSLEIFNDQFRGGSARSISVDGHRSLVYLMDQVRREEPGRRRLVPPMPDRIAVSGVEFVEFAATPETAPSLVRFFHGMGFAQGRPPRLQGRDPLPPGRHQPRRQHRARGLRPLRLPHPRRRRLRHRLPRRGRRRHRRARRRPRRPALRAARRPGRARASRRSAASAARSCTSSTRARRSPGSGRPSSSRPRTTSPSPTPASLAIDHVAQTMPYDEMLSWLLFYTSIFRTAKAPMVDIIDPSGIVRSQAIENAEGTLRLTLNGAENTRTFAGHFIAEVVRLRASSTSPSPRATSSPPRRRCAANGFETLAISPNYYDDVEARFGLDPDFADRLQAANILYDRDEHGEYFQLYSPNFGEGFFFEIVERRGGYRGYGAPNAPFRIAAQKRHLRPKGMPRA